MSILDNIFWRKRRRELLNQMFNNTEDKEVYGEYARLIRIRRILIIIICVVIFLNVIGSIYYYNKFVNLEQNVGAVRADIESCLQMRENLIPVLVNTVSDFVKHEDDVFFHSADARADSIGRQKVKTGIKTGDDWSNLLSKLFAVAERYPDLKVSESFQLLMSKVAEAEKAILDKRIEYNNAANQFNTSLISFPGRLVSFIFRFKKAEYFKWKGEPEWVSTMKEAQ